MTIFEVLRLRSEWEEIVRDYKFVSKEGTIENMKAFLDSGHKSNRFRSKYKRAMEIANEIVSN